MRRRRELVDGLAGVDRAPVGQGDVDRRGDQERRQERVVAGDLADHHHDGDRGVGHAGEEGPHPDEHEGPGRRREAREEERAEGPEPAAEERPDEERRPEEAPGLGHADGQRRRDHLRQREREEQQRRRDNPDEMDIIVKLIMNLLS